MRRRSLPLRAMQMSSNSRTISVAPGIVVGQLHRGKLWEWSRGNDLRAVVKIVAS